MLKSNDNNTLAGSAVPPLAEKLNRLTMHLDSIAHNTKRLELACNRLGADGVPPSDPSSSRPPATPDFLSAFEETIAGAARLARELDQQVTRLDTTV